jgi:PAS domain S-box-containing protein
MSDSDRAADDEVSILLVDDEPANLLALRAVLEDLGNNLVEVRSGEEALRRIRNEDFAVVLLDVQMQGLDGLATARMIRGCVRSRHTPIIFITAFDSPADKIAEAYALGAVDYLVKPIIPEILRAKVAVFVDLFRKTERIRRLEREQFERRIAEEKDRRDQTALAITRIVAEFDSEADAIRRVLEAVCENLLWDAGALWEVDATGRGLHCTEFWHHSATHVPEFEIASRKCTLGIGRGLPGRVWASKEAVWIPGIVADANFPRFQAAAEEGLRSAAAFPLIADGEFLGVMEFFSREFRETDEESLRMLADVGARFGQVMGRRRVEAALAESEMRKRAILEASLDCVITIDHEGKVVEWNPAAERTFGYGRHEALGRDMGELIVPPSLREAHRAGIARYLTTGEGTVVGRRVEMTAVRADGSEFFAELAIVAIPSGDKPLFTGFLRDVTERKRAEQAVKESEENLRREDRRKDEFLATLAHELRNPLAPLRNGLRIIKLAGGDADAVEQARLVMERQLEHMVRLVDDLLDVSRISRGKIELRKERIDVTQVVRIALEACESVIAQLDHELTVALPGEPVHVNADKTRLAQAVSNLLNNAAKYTDRGGRIQLTVERKQNDVVISVRDNGVGIPAPMLPKVFEMFVQADQSLEKSQGGLGIGLTIVKQLVEMHDGRVDAKSEGPGRGSEFVIRLPVASLVLQAPPKPFDDARSVPSDAACRVLVVDDNADAADTLAMMLTIMGSDVRIEHDGLGAVEAAVAFRPDLILLDIGMPKLNGYEACRRIREQARSEGVVIVAVTGWGQDADKRRSEAAGFDHHLTKPADPAVLQELLRTTRRRGTASPVQDASSTMSE